MGINWRRLALPVGIGVLASTAFIGAAVAASRTRTPKRPARRPRGITPEIDRIARKWAAARGLPPAWVLSTIMVESGGDPTKVTLTDKEASYGLMQINTNAHRKRLESYGIRTAPQLLDPDNNIRVGTELLREAWDNVARALGGKTPPAPLDVLVRYSYVGPLPTRLALREGKHPRETKAFAARAATVEGRWARALAKTGTVV